MLGSGLDHVSGLGSLECALKTCIVKKKTRDALESAFKWNSRYCFQLGKDESGNVSTKRTLLSSHRVRTSVCLSALAVSGRWDSFSEMESGDQDDPFFDPPLWGLLETSLPRFLKKIQRNICVGGAAARGPPRGDVQREYIAFALALKCFFL